MAEPARRFLTFRLDRSLYALPAEEVAEVIRLPVVAKVPLSPASLMGVGNLRGSVLPVASLGGLLGRPSRTVGAASRAIVLRGAGPVALAVDRVEALVSVEADRVETHQAELAAAPGEQITGAFRAGVGQEAAKVLDVRAMLASAFVARPQRPRSAGLTDSAVGTAALRAEVNEKLVTFEVAGQEFAFKLAEVREITPPPDELAVVPKSETLVLGVGDYRGGLLPLFSLRGLLGFPAGPITGRERVVVTTVAGVLVGLVADRMRAILPAEADLIEPTPSVLTARTGGEAQITAIYRGDGGRRLVSILSPERLFREDVMRRLADAAKTAQRTESAARASLDVRRYLVFRLGGDEFGLPIEAVDEVAAAPAQLTRIPKAPKFLEGVINLRGAVLPVVDQRKRFEMPPLSEPGKRRLVVVRTERHRAGLLVDSVSDVIAAEAADLEPALDLTGEAGRLVEGVLNLEAAGRMILVLGPAELLSPTERRLLDAFEAKQDGS